MKNSQWYNTMNEAFYYEQIIDEACNGDYGFNHFRKLLTVADCVDGFRNSQVIKEWAKCVVGGI